MPRASKKRRAAALKGWETRRRRERAKKRKRRRRPYAGVEIKVGYRGRDNSFSLTVLINPHKPIAKYNDDQLADLVEKLAQSGHFDNAASNSTADLSWVFFNDWEVTRRDVRIGRGKARLVDFSRSAPRSLP